MSKRLAGTLITMMSILFLASLVFNWYQYRQSQQMHDAAYGGGFYLAVEGVNRAYDIFSEDGQAKNEDIADAVMYISESAEVFQAFSHVMGQMGVEHTMGIGVELEQDAQVISHPQKYPKSQIQQAEKFVEIVSVDFRPCWNAQFLVKSRLPGAIDKIYKAMPSQDRQQLYSM
ncbi:MULTISPECIES: hypothetical protein [Alicyclobacillus]|uniref:Uncharacterized protein n=1 Tax=Alicyclobacillus acidoterrestris (strain ATCC 49025 / DSM 3922 / CIP 106132 / NCIMB 13137 / GD3B) TaxID=1356854 RepID=T0CIU4_ALIAG|nr:MULTISPECIES: hypothetical protein [Alicyclobacillus]EPZ52734.1 hypothetical protein N007_19895 [Alicyclobacillus acidoterrestris ATCC 49025]UNO47609.1 hypothetical protein K1I37_12975 [Alicyclobacillus acidoterrestris]